MRYEGLGFPELAERLSPVLGVDITPSDLEQLASSMDDLVIVCRNLWSNSRRIPSSKNFIRSMVYHAKFEANRLTELVSAAEPKEEEGRENPVKKALTALLFLVTKPKPRLLHIGGRDAYPKSYPL